MMRLRSVSASSIVLSGSECSATPGILNVDVTEPRAKDQMVEAQGHLGPGDRMLQFHALGIEIDAHDLAQNVLRALELPAHGRNDVAGFDSTRADFRAASA